MPGLYTDYDFGRYCCSLAFTGKIVRGTQQYVCTGRTWTETGSSADMLTPSGAKLGTYWSTNNKGSITYFWTIINSAGVSSESGLASSGLQGELESFITVYYTFIGPCNLSSLHVFLHFKHFLGSCMFHYFTLFFYFEESFIFLYFSFFFTLNSS